MIIDTIKNAHKYYSVHPLFERAFQYINETDLANAENGKADIAEGLKAIISNAAGKLSEESLKKFECHDENIDIQLCIKGNETIGWKPRENVLFQMAIIILRKMFVFLMTVRICFFN